MASGGPVRGRMYKEGFSRGKRHIQAVAVRLTAEETNPPEFADTLRGARALREAHFPGAVSWSGPLVTKQTCELPSVLPLGATLRAGRAARVWPRPD